VIHESHVVAVGHDVLELAVDVGGRPCKSLTVLGHLETRDSNATTVGSLCRGWFD
jgi:hypothetical protein